MLDLDGIHKTYNRKKVLEDVSFHVPKGSIVGLLGPNGAGKTTLIRIINRIIEQDRGFVSFKNKMMTEEHLKEIGYLPEERGLYRTMKVQEHAIYLGRLRGMSKRDALQQFNYWIELFDIGDWRNKRIEELSKGMGQKVQFICTVLHQPDFLILDEPFSGFDPINVELIRAELLEMKAKGKTILLSTHNMKSVEEICDRAILIHEGKKVLEGEVWGLRDAHKEGLFAVKFSGNMIAFANALWAGYEIDSKEVHNDNLFTVNLRMRGENNFNDLLGTLIQAVNIVIANEVLPSMEEVFMKNVTTPRKEVDHV
jgi:ABC-2 type transport system ATP-binding protein